MNVSTENLQLTLKFKTPNPDGLLFVYLSRMQTASMQDSISLSLIKGEKSSLRSIVRISVKVIKADCRFI